MRICWPAAARSTELEAKIKELWGNKLSLIPEFWDRLTALDTKVKSLKDTLAKQVKVYTVGTWSKDRDCLWNISKKPDIYDNAWMWPRIWQGNRDQIKDPDVIQTGQKLTIPKGTEMSAEEKTAARKYYHARQRAAAAAAAAAPAPRSTGTGPAGSGTDTSCPGQVILDDSWSSHEPPFLCTHRGGGSCVQRGRCAA